MQTVIKEAFPQSQEKDDLIKELQREIKELKEEKVARKLEMEAGNRKQSEVLSLFASITIAYRSFTRPSES